jgi:hypothetical protein
MKRIAILFLASFALAEEPAKVWVRAPAEDLLPLFEKRGGGFLISLEEYERLVALARANERRLAERPPVAARLVRGAASARVEGDALRIEARYTAVVASDGPSEVPFSVEGLAIEEVSAGGGELAGSALRFDAAGTYDVRAVFSARLEARGDARGVELALPPASGQTVELEIPGEVEGEVGPVVRAFRSGPEGARVVGHPDGQGRFTLWFRPKARAFRLDPILSASFEARAELGEARTAAKIALQIEALRAPVERVELSIPKGLVIADLGGRGVRSWAVRRGGDADALEVRFVEPLLGAAELSLEAELPRDGAATVEIPLVRVPAAVRFRGTVAIAAQPEVRVTGLSAEGARRLVHGDASAVALYEIWTARGGVRAEVESVVTRTTATTRAALALLEEGKALRARIHYSVRRRSLYRLEPRLPAGWILRRALLDGSAVDHAYEPDGRLVLVFPSGLKPGEHVLDVALDTDEPEWVPAAGAATFEFPGVRSGIEEESGWFVVASDPAFGVAVEATNGLRPVGMPEIEAAGFRASDRVLFAWRSETGAYAARFRLERRAPQVTATVLQRLLPGERALDVRASIFLEIERAGVREIRLALPKGTGPLVDIRGDGIKEKRAPAAGADPEMWTLALQRRVRGPYRVDVAFEKRMDADAWSTEVPEIAVPDASERGFVVVEASPTTAITVERNGLREADVAELPEPPARPPLEVLAYAAHPFRVRIASRRHDPSEVVQAVALSASVYGVLTADGALRCRAEYRVRNNDQPFLFFDLPPRSDLLGVVVNGEPAKPLLEGGRMKIPLPRSRGRTEPFVVAIVYESEAEGLEGGGDVTIGRPRLDVDVLKTEYALHLPRGLRLVDHDGDLVPLDRRERESVLEALGEALSGLISRGRLAAREEEPRSRAGPQASPPSGPAAGPEPGGEKAKSATRRARDDAGDEERAAESDANAAAGATEQLEELKEAAEGGGPAGGETADLDRGAEIAKAGLQPTPAPKAPPPPPKRRIEKALLSLDIHFLRPDNVVRMESFAPTGSVTLSFAPETDSDRLAYLGALAGAVAGIFLLRARVRILRLLAAGTLAALALHFGGLSFLAPEFALGAARAFFAFFGLALLWRLLRRLPLRPPGRRIAAPLLLLAATARAGDELIAPYDPKDPDRIDRVFLDAEAYHRLRALAYPDEPSRRTAILSAEYVATLSGEELSVVARYVVAKETDLPERFPLGLQGTAVASATLDGAPANVLVAEDGLHLALARRGRFTVELSLRPILSRDGEARAFAAPVVPAPSATLRVDHDRPNHEVTAAALGRRDGDTWRLGPVGLLSVAFRPRTEGFVAPRAELRADTQAVVAVRDGYTGIAARIRYGISGGKADRFRLRVDPSLVVRSVAAPGLAGWEIGADGVLVVALAKPVEGVVAVDVVAERPAERERTETFPEVAPLDVLRDAGVIAIDTLPDLKLEILDAQGLLRGREADAPKGLAAAPDPGEIHSVHRFAVRPFRLAWRVSLEPTRLSVASRVDVLVGRERVDARVEASVTVERGPGPFTLRMRAPAGFEVVGVRGDGARDHWLRDGVLFVERTARQQGTVAYVVELTRRLDASAPFDAPAVEWLGAARETGIVRVGGGEGLEVDASDALGLLPEDVAKAGPTAWGPTLRAFRYVSVPWRVTLRAREEAREVESIVVSRVLPLDDWMRVETLVYFYARRGLVDTLSFRVPVADRARVHVSAPDLREERSEPVEGALRYTLALRTPTRGSASASVTYYVPYGAPLRGVDPLAAARVQRYVAVEKIPHGEVRAGGARNLDPGVFADLPFHAPESSAGSVAAVFVGGEAPFELEVAVKRHAFEEIAKAVIYRASADALVDRSGFVRVQVGYRVYNRTEQFLRLRLPEGATLYSAFVAGEPVRPLRDGGLLLVPLRKVALGAPTFDAEVVYAYAGPAPTVRRLRVALPQVSGIDVRRTTLTLHLPKGFSYDFDSEMERVDAADIKAYEAGDVYQEIKDLYAVAQRGNRWQAERALENTRQLAAEARRLLDEVRSAGKDDAVVRQVEAQQEALGKLVQVQPQKQTALYVEPRDASEEARVRQVTEWTANALGNFARTEEARKQLSEFEDKQARYRDLAQTLQPRPPPIAGAGRPVELEREGDETLLSLFAGEPEAGSAAEGLVGGAGGGGGRRALRRFGGKAGGLAKKADAGDARESAESLPDFVAGMQTAKGRVSIRVDLPLEGESYHFARLGAAGEVSFEASERGGRLLASLLGLLCLLGAMWGLAPRSASATR